MIRKKKDYFALIKDNYFTKDYKVSVKYLVEYFKEFLKDPSNQKKVVGI